MAEHNTARTRHPKVKTGCITCRNRRVKCDETRPHCIRCQKYGTRCEGYLPGRRRPPSSVYGSFATQARELVPKKQQMQSRAAQQQAYRKISIQPTTQLFETQQELRYFRLFAERIASEISPYFKPDAWSRMILQACQSESSIRHAAIAIGALGKMYEIAQHGQCPITGQKLIFNFDRIPTVPSTTKNSRSGQGPATEELVNEASMHHRYALEQYDKAIKRMRNDISHGNQSMRTTLIICIIIVCFEAIHGNHESAARQLQSGLMLIQDWQSSQNNRGAHPQGFSSPAPDIVDDFLVQTFGRMEIQAMSVFDPRPATTHQLLRTEGHEAVRHMPSKFSSVEEARIYLDLIQRRLMHFNASIHTKSRTGLKEAAFPSAPGVDTPAMPWIDGTLPPVTRTTSSTTPHLISEQQCLNNELSSWIHAFEPLLSSVKVHINGIDAQTIISIYNLSLSSLSCQVSLHSAFMITESSYDIFMPEFEMIVDHATILLQVQNSLTSPHPSPSPKSSSSHTSPTTSHSSIPSPPLSSSQSPTYPLNSHLPQTPSTGSKNIFRTSNRSPIIHFTFEIGIIPPLYLVIVKCRSPSLRRRALSLLEQNPRREGVWDSVATAGLGEWIIGLEESGISQASAQDFPSPPFESGRMQSLTQGYMNCGSNNDRSSNVPSPPLSNRSSPDVRVKSEYGSAGSGRVNGVIEAQQGMEMFIPEEVRVRKAAMRFDLMEKRANMTCLQLDPKTGMLIQRKEQFFW